MKSKKCGAKPNPKHARPEEQDIERCELTLFVKLAERRRFGCDVHAVFSRPGSEPIRHLVATDGKLEHPIEFVKAGMMLRLFGWRKVCERRPSFREDQVTLENFVTLSLNRTFGTVEVYERPILDGRPPDEPRIELEAFDRFLRLGGKPNGND